MGVAARVTRLGRRLVAATHDLAQGINERRFLAHVALANLLSREPHLRECATPVDHLRQLVENAYHATSQPSLSLPIRKLLQASAVARNSIREPEQWALYRRDRPHDSPHRIVRSQPANAGR